MPGIRPLFAISLKQIRQSPNRRRYPFFRPHLKHRRVIRELNFGFFFDLAICALVAITLRLYIYTLAKQGSAER